MTLVVTSGRAQEYARVINPLMRGLVEGLLSPRPIGVELPAALQDDEFCQRMMVALDEVLAPIFSTLDCLDTYLDPKLAPYDFVEWLASWVGVEIDETWTLERRRQLIQDAVMLYRIRGTAAGVAAHIRLYAGVSPEIEETGACEWSQTADTPMPGSPQLHLTVRLRVDHAGTVKRSTLSRIVAAARPAHVPYQVEVLVEGKAVSGTDEVVSTPGADEHAPGAVDLPGSERIELAAQAPPSQEELDEPSEAPSGEDDSPR